MSKKWLDELIDWSKKAWPLVDFERFKEKCSIVGTNTPVEISKKDIALFPNPSNDHLTIEIPDTFFDKQAEINIYSIVGNIILTKKTFQKNSTINIGRLSSGSYIIKVFSNGSSFTKKFIKQ